MKEYIIYIPGLGDHYDGLRQRSLSWWRIFGVKTELVPMQWYDGKPHADKQQLLHHAINKALNNGYRVSLVGESAGASIAMAAFADDNRLHRLVTLCGVIDPDAVVSPKIYRRGPAFKTAMANLSQINRSNLGSRRVTVITSLYDPVVSQKTNIIPGNRPIRIPSIGHLVTITLCLTIYSLVVIRQVKK